MKNTKDIIDFYASQEIIGSNSAEFRLLEGIYKLQTWNKLSDQEKLESRRRDVNWYKVKFPKEDYHKLTSYEDAMINLLELIIAFLGSTDSMFHRFTETAEHAENDTLLFRLRNMLACEKEAALRLPQAKNNGHVPFEVVLPLFRQLEDSGHYLKYGLHKLKLAFENCWNLHLAGPYDE